MINTILESDVIFNFFELLINFFADCKIKIA